MGEQNTEIRIYVACLAAYNNGRLHGRWIDAEQDADTIQSEIADMLAASPIPNAEEWAIHDYEGFEGAPISEYEGVDSVAEKAAFIARHGLLAGKLLEHWSGDLQDARRSIENHYIGAFPSLEDFARDMTEQSEDISDTIAPYIDYARMGRDMALGDVFTIDLGFEETHIFWAR